MEVYEQIKKDISFLLGIVIISYTIITVFEIGVDDTDNKETGKRSGLRLHTDYGTGVQYISDGNSLIIRGK